MSYDFEERGNMFRPSPDYPDSGFVPRETPSYAQGSAAGPAPEGMVFVPGLNTYVDHDVAASLGLGPSGTSAASPMEATSFDPHGLRSGGDPFEDAHIPEMTDDELAAAREELDGLDDHDDISPTVTELVTALTPEVFDAGLEAMVTTGDFEETLRVISDSTGLDAEGSSMLVETAVGDATPVALEAIGGAAWDSIIYAATSTDDSLARRVVSDFVTGALDRSQLSRAYSLWYRSLPDAD